MWGWNGNTGKDRKVSTAQRRRKLLRPLPTERMLPEEAEPSCRHYYDAAVVSRIPADEGPVRQVRAVAKTHHVRRVAIGGLNPGALLRLRAEAE